MNEKVDPYRFLAIFRDKRHHFLNVAGAHHAEQHDTCPHQYECAVDNRLNVHGKEPPFVRGGYECSLPVFHPA